VKAKILCLLLALVLAGAAGAQPEASGRGDAIYGAELMTEEEIETYREHLRVLDDPEAREEFLEAHREWIDRRAGERGVAIFDPGYESGLEGGFAPATGVGAGLGPVDDEVDPEPPRSER
jgi:hypothetical protein